MSDLKCSDNSWQKPEPKQSRLIQNSFGTAFNRQQEVRGNMGENGGALVLIACEYSGTIRDQFWKRGIRAVSCDVLPTTSKAKNTLNVPYEGHYEGDIRDILADQEWDLMIAHPPCTYLSRAGARWLYAGGELQQGRYEKLLDARAFFMELWSADIPMICIENPTPFKIANLPEPSQIIQPFQFGDPYTKRTLLWQKGLDNLEHSNVVKSVGSWLPSNTSGFRKNQKSQKGQSKSGDYSLTFEGIAHAMATQWGGLL